MKIVKQIFKVISSSMWIQLVLIGIVSTFVLVSRRPSAITNPQFFAEDGTFWFTQAYNEGVIKSFFVPRSGYFQTLSRIGALFAVWGPIALAPLSMNLFAVFIQLLPIFLIWINKRSYFSTKSKLFLIISYLLLFNIKEIHLNLTNAMWFLAISCYLILISQKPVSKFWQAFHLGIILISGLSGPFSIFILPVAFIWVYFNRQKWNYIKLGMIAVTGLIQLFSVTSSRSGQTFQGFPTLIDSFNVFSRQVVWGLLAGEDGYYWLANISSIVNSFIFLIPILTILIVGYTLYKSQLEIKLFILFGFLIFTSSLLFPTIQTPANTTSWQVLAEASGIRYWLIPMLSVLVSLVWSLRNKNPKYIKIIATVILGIMVFFWIRLYSHPKFWKFTPREDFFYAQQLEEFKQLTPGTTYNLKHPPVGWESKLVSK